MKPNSKKDPVKDVLIVLIAFESIVFYYVLLYPFLGDWGESRLLLTLNMILHWVLLLPLINYLRRKRK